MISPLLLMTHPGKQFRKYAIINMVSRDLITNSFQGMIRRCQNALMLKGVLSQMRNMFKLDCRY